MHKKPISKKFARLILPACLILSLPALLLFNTSPPSQDTSKAFEQRKNTLINHYKSQQPRPGNNIAKDGFWVASAHFYDYEVNGASKQLAEAQAIVNDCLDSMRDHFGLWGGIDNYLRYGHLYDEALKKKVKLMFLSTYGYSNDLNTPNKKLMGATARYLAHETWPEDTFMSGYAYNDPTGKNTILDTISTYVHRGQTEWNSEVYWAMHYGCLRTLADLAKDPEIKSKAAIAAEWMLASVAGEWFNGHLACAQERVYEPLHVQGDYNHAPSSLLLWLHFGGPEPADYFAAEGFYAIQSAVTSFMCPSIIVNIANDRSKEYLHKEMHHHYKTDWATDFYHYMTSYVNKKYAIYSEHDQINPALEYVSAFSGYYKQMLRWGVCWENPNGKSTFLLQHPFNYKVENFGATAYEQVLQNKGTIIGVYDIPKNNANPWIYGWIPTNHTTFIDASNEGKIYLNYDKVMIALYLTSAFQWDSSSENLLQPADKIGLVVETADPDDYSGATPSEKLESFRRTVDAQLKDVVWNPSENGGPVLKYTSLDGIVMETKYNGNNSGYDKINNEVVDYSPSSWPLLENPWMSQAYDGNLTLTYGKEKRIYNFIDWTVTEK